MRSSREAKTRHHEEITAAAAKMLRERGIERTSINDLMKSVGLTHGGFYRHFKSKDELVAMSTAKAFAEVVDRFAKRTAEAGATAALADYVEEYLSEEHRDHPSQGCIVSACGADAPRQGEIVREVFTQGIDRLLDLAKNGLQYPSTERRERAFELASLMLGAVVMARAASDAELSTSILGTARKRASEIMELRA
jgi:TetR/AcrR family transcriptional repressor of nem operon